MRADRLLSILLLLQIHERMTARELAERLEVSQRTILRDMEALSVAGIPVVAERGSNGGWRLLGDYQTDLTGLSPLEIQSLFLTKPPRILADLGLRQAAESALIKLFAALPSMYRRDAEFVRQRIHIDGGGWRHSAEDMGFLPLIQEAIWQEKSLHLTYRRQDGTHVERQIDPLGLVAKGSTWYLVAGVDGECRTYRISRVMEATILAEPCNRPENFDLATYWDKSTTEFRANLPHYPAVVRVAPSLISRMRWSGRFVNITKTEFETPDVEGWIRVHLHFETNWEACEYLLSFGAEVEVLEPAELREKIIQAAQSVLDFYVQRGLLDS